MNRHGGDEMEYKRYDVKLIVVVGNVLETSPEKAALKARNFLIECIPGPAQLCAAVTDAAAQESGNEE